MSEKWEKEKENIGRVKKIKKDLEKKGVREKNRESEKKKRREREKFDIKRKRDSEKR